jgi:hypothetical protein
MKKTIALLAFSVLFITNSFAGDFESTVVPKNEQGHMVYEKVVEVNNVSKEELYKRVKAWVMDNVKTIDNNIQYDDKGSETIITTPTIALENLKNNHVVNQKVNFKLKILFKDNKMKITASSFIYYGEDVQHRVFNTPLEDLKITRIIPSPVKKIQELFDDTFGGFVADLSKSAAASSGSW